MMGLTGSLHCAGMCGPIMLMIPFETGNRFRKWTGMFLYHAGRISVYAFLGWLIYTFKSFFHPGWQQSVSVIAGIVLLLIGLGSFISIRRVALPGSAWVVRHLGKFLGNPAPEGLFLSGALHGFLPCGLVYMALSLAVGADSPVQAVFLMYAFGAGTLPMLIGITLFRNRVSFFRKEKLRRIAPFLLLAFGILFILRGMNLGIPYVSPEFHTEKGVIQADCCHKE